MTGTTTHFALSAGHVHSGSGDQYNIYTEAAARRLGTRGKGHRAVAEEQLDHLRDRYIAPPAYLTADDFLRRNNTIALRGRDGDGRTSTALMLLYGLAGHGTGIHEVDSRADEDGEALDPDVVGEQDRLLLDLSGSDEAHFIQVQEQLSEFRAVVRTRGARLVIVLPSGLDDLLQAELRPVTVEVGRPKWETVLERHLSLFGIQTAQGPAEVGAFLSTASMAALARFADLVRRQRDRRPHEGTAAWQAAARAEMADHGDAAARAVAGTSDGRQRALLLTLGVFYDAPHETLFLAREHLLRELGHPRDERPRLEHPDLRAELSVIRDSDTATRDTFGTEAFHKAVRDHFWTCSPDLRSALQRWVEVCIHELGLHAGLRAAVVERFGATALRSAQPDHLLWLARDLTSRGSHARFIPDAAQALAMGLRDEANSRLFRDQILEWARESGHNQAFRNVLVLVCRQVMAVRHSDQALVRLHHLALHEPRDTRRLALEALTDLAAGDRRLCRLLLARCDPERRPGNAEIFATFASTVARRPHLHADPVVRDRLTNRWRETLSRPSETWTPGVESWFDIALDSAVHRERLLVIIAEAVSANPTVAGCVYSAVRRWARAGTGREAVLNAFRRTLDTAQGVDITAPMRENARSVP